MSEKKDLDHDTGNTDEMVKSVNPNKDYMDQRGLCSKCHGPNRRCDRAGCPN